MEQHKNVPAIRFEGFEGEWEVSKLFFDTIYKNGKGHENMQAKNGKFELINLNSISISGGLKPSGKFIDSVEETLQKDDLVMILSDVGHGDLLGRVAIIPTNDKYILNQRVALLRIKNDVINNPLYYYYNINTHQKYFKLNGAGMSQLNLSKISVENYEFFKPNLLEQTQIGNFFKTLDSQITLQEQKYYKLVNLKKAMLEKMFPKEGADVPEIRFKGFTEKWKEKMLGDVANIIGGGTPSTSVKEYWNGDINWFSPTEIDNSIYAYDSNKKITKLGLEKSSAKILPANKTILFTSRAGIGDMAILKKEAATNQGFQSLVVNNNFDVYFIFSLGKAIKKRAIIKASGSTFLEISGKTLGLLNFKFPSLEEQQKIGEYFEKLDSLIQQSQEQIKKYKNIKQALLQKMFV